MGCSHMSLGCVPTCRWSSSLDKIDQLQPTWLRLHLHAEVYHCRDEAEVEHLVESLVRPNRVGEEGDVPLGERS